MKELNNIYFFWWQGIDNAPDIVKICYKSLLEKYDPKLQKINIIDSKNFKEYVDVPEYILQKFQKGIISITHLSDLIRFMLLYKNGGLWVDATMLFTQQIDNQIFEKKFFCLKNPNALKGDITSKWECFYIGGKKHYELFKILSEFWLDYWKKENQLITYLLTEHIFYIAYNENKEIRMDFENLDEFYYKIDYFQRKLNLEFNYNTYMNICKNEKAIKLTYKKKLIEYCGQKLTYFGWLKEKYNV